MLLQILGLGPAEMLVVVLFIVLLLLGPKKIPELFHSLGQSVGEFKKGVKESNEESPKPKKKKAE
jgi:TatA/E family protein of Tat protein translocase